MKCFTCSYGYNGIKFLPPNVFTLNNLHVYAKQLTCLKFEYKKDS